MTAMFIIAGVGVAWLGCGWLAGYVTKNYDLNHFPTLGWRPHDESFARTWVLTGLMGLLIVLTSSGGSAWHRPAHYPQTSRRSWFGNPSPATVTPTTASVDLLKSAVRSAVARQQTIISDDVLKFGTISAAPSSLSTTPAKPMEAPPLPTEADKLGYITAYRSWSLAGLGVLLSQSTTPWPFRQPLVAECKKPDDPYGFASLTIMVNRHASPPPPPEPEPKPTGSAPHEAHWMGGQADRICGIHGLMEPGESGLLRGTVALWGTVFEHETGYRAEFAYPLTITVVRCANCKESIGADGIWLTDSLYCSLPCASVGHSDSTARDTVPAAEVLGPLAENYGIEVPA